VAGFFPPRLRILAWTYCRFNLCGVRVPFLVSAASNKAPQPLGGRRIGRTGESGCD
jgi:hypothetical protein